MRRRRSYNPPDNGLIDGSRYEFIELRNVGLAAVDLLGFRLDGGIDYTFVHSFRLEPEASAVLIQEPLEFMARYPDVPYLDVNRLRLKNSGESLALETAQGWVLESFTYGDSLPWPELGDGRGHTLVRRMPIGDPAYARSWRASAHLHGSPAVPDPPVEW